MDGQLREQIDRLVGGFLWWHHRGLLFSVLGLHFHLLRDRFTGLQASLVPQSIGLHADRDTLLHPTSGTVSPCIHVHLAASVVHHLAFEGIPMARVPPEERLTPLAGQGPVVHAIGFVPAHHTNEIGAVRTGRVRNRHGVNASNLIRCTAIILFNSKLGYKVQ